MSAALKPISQLAPFRRAGGIGLGRIYVDERFDYTTGPITFTTGLENFTPSIPIQFDAHFLCVETTFSNSLVVAAAGALPPTIRDGGATVQLTDGASQKPLQNAQIPLACLFGNANEPFVWPMPHLFIANSPLLINITGSGATMAGGVIRLVFSGYKVPVDSIQLEA